MKLFSSQRFLAVYSGILTLAFAATIVAGFAESRRNASFDQIDVQRINIVGPDGKNQLVISNRRLIPEGVIDGKTFQSHGRHDGAGMIFYNNEGDEDGGISFSGRKTPSGYTASGGLMFDQYKQDQTVGIEYTDHNGKREAGFHVWDRPDTDLAQMIEHLNAVKNMAPGPQKEAAMKRLQEEAKNGAFGATRFFAGKTPDKTAVVLLSDAQGHPRMRLSVSAAGQAQIDFLDASGKVTYSIPQQAGK